MLCNLTLEHTDPLACRARRAAPVGDGDGDGDGRSSPHTQPVGLGRPATLQAPLAGPDGKSS